MTPANRLSAETSPYLLQHADNPVHWQPWDEQALAQARQTDRPILLSIGYSACHWCHVMAHECFEDPEVAAVMNRLFVNIKVDREERPDLDQIYQSAHYMLTRRNGGWPLTMFLAPDGTPFFGGTYFPKQSGHGLPGFADLCQRVAEAWRDKREDIAAQAGEFREAFAASIPDAPAQGVALSPDPIAAAEALLARAFDPVHGGFGGAPKFPHPTDLDFLLGRRSEQSRRMALTTLRRMGEGGINDQIGGGFCRYSVDARWEIPHFEKMLHDNGPLLGLYADAWALTGDCYFAQLADATAAWTMREMQDAAGGYFSSLDADSEGEEGRFYVWDRDEVSRLLTPEESALAARRWGFDGAPNFEGRRWQPRIAGELRAGEESALESARQKLFAARERRARPGCDDKILTAWNALMIEGMAHAARALRREDWGRSARLALDYLRTMHWRDGRLLATSRDGRAQLPAYLDDHAFLLAALLEVMQLEFRGEDLAWAVELADVLLAQFEDDRAGGFFFTAHDHEALIHRPKTGHDGATPAGNGLAAWALQRLGYLLGETRYLAAAERTLRLFWPQLRQSPGGHSSLLRALEESLEPPDIVILRGPAPDLGEWTAALGARRQRMVLTLANGTRDLPAALAKPEPDRVNAWVCRGVSCSAPTANIDDLRT
jgi:uncharacterized protein YyaL (SSP411 family)